MIKEKAYAKINLTLDVVKKRSDGYHELKMIMIPIELHDELTFEAHNEIILKSNIEIEDNAIIKAAKKMQETYHIQEGAKITLEKHIPIGGGLAGGSADIAATLRGLNQLWNLNKPLEELEDLALSLGSDTLFCLYEKPAYVYGRGEGYLFIDMPPIESVYLITSDQHVSTANIFKHHHVKHHPRQFDRLFRNYLNQKYTLFFKQTYNHLLKTTLKCYPNLKRTTHQLKKLKTKFMMTGSGATFYLLTFKDNDVEYHEKLNNLGLVFLKTKPKI